MRDPLWIDPTDLEFYKQAHPRYVSDYVHRTPEQLAKDITVCHENLRKQIVINVKLVGQVERLKLYIRVLITANVALWALFLILFKWGLPLAMKGLAMK